MRHLRLENVTTDTEVNILLVLALGPLRDLVLRHLPAKSAGLLWTEVKRLELLALVELTQARALLEVDDREGASNVLAHRVDAAELARAAASHLLDTELEELSLQLIEERKQVRLGLVVEIVSANLGLYR